MSKWLAIALLCASCEPAVSGPVNIMAILYDQQNQLGPHQTQITTLGNVSHLKGTVGNLVGGAQIILDPNNPSQKNLLNLTDDQLADALYADRGSDVRADLIDKSGVLWPADFHSWDMVTLYWNFEQAFLYQQQMYDGSETTELEGATILYWADYENLAIGDPNQQKLTDNALYYSPLRAFLIAPYHDEQCTADGGMSEPPGCNVPIPMNTGIIGHEYAHRVFNLKAGGGAAVPAYLSWLGSPLNIIKGMDEGLADFHGYGVTCSSAASGGPGCSTNFLEPSFGNSTVVRDRDFSLEDKCMSAELQNAIGTLTSDQFLSEGEQYKLGTLFAAALYQAGNKTGGNSGTQEVAKALIRAYDDETNGTPGFKQVFDANLNTPDKITLEKLSDVILSHITDPTLQKYVCNELWDRLNLNNPDPNGALTHCPNTSQRGTTSCPALP